MEDVVLEEVLQASISRTQPAAVAKTIALDLEAPPLRCRAHPERLEDAIVELLENAIRFTPAFGTIELRARSSCGRVVIEIADTGCGIDPAFVPYVWSHSRGEGLVLVGRIIDAHGGDYYAMSAGSGLGSIFVLEIPAASESSGVYTLGLARPAARV